MSLESQAIRNKTDNSGNTCYLVSRWQTQQHEATSQVQSPAYNLPAPAVPVTPGTRVSGLSVAQQEPGCGVGKGQVPTYMSKDSSAGLHSADRGGCGFDTPRSRVRSSEPIKKEHGTRGLLNYYAAALPRGFISNSPSRFVLPDYRGRR